MIHTKVCNITYIFFTYNKQRTQVLLQSTIGWPRFTAIPTNIGSAEDWPHSRGADEGETGDRGGRENGSSHDGCVHRMRTFKHQKRRSCRQTRENGSIPSRSLQYRGQTTQAVEYTCTWSLRTVHMYPWYS